MENKKQKTKALGIVAEYNPFHNGHKYHLEESLKLSGAQVCVAAMSGNFSQRGEPAVADKWARAEAAVKNGVNLVVEIPTIFACNNAGYFANAAVEILENLGADYISFGSESGNLETLQEISGEILRSEDLIEEYIRSAVKNGVAYPRARQEILCKLTGKRFEGLLGSPNNLLAIEYLKHIKTAKPITIKRKGPGYNDDMAEETFASASYLRANLDKTEQIKELMPDITREMLDKTPFISKEVLFNTIALKLLTMKKESLESLYCANEGLGNKLKNEIRKATSYEDFLIRLKSKRYTMTRISRILAYVLLEVGKEDVSYGRNYIRVLALDEKGSAYLKEIKKSGECRLPIITNVNKDFENYPEILPTFAVDVKAADVYNIMSQRNLYEYSEYVKGPFIMRKNSD